MSDNEFDYKFWRAFLIFMAVCIAAVAFSGCGPASHPLSDGGVHEEPLAKRPAPEFIPAGFPGEECRLITGLACYPGHVMRCSCLPGETHCNEPYWAPVLDCEETEQCGWTWQDDGLPVLGCVPRE